MARPWLLSAALLLACNDSNNNDKYSSFDASVTADAGADAPAGDAAVIDTFSSLYTEIFAKHGCPGCHVNTSHPSKLSWASRDAAYEGLVGKNAAGIACGDGGEVRVVPGDANASLLIHKLEGKDAQGKDVCGARMPLGLPPLSQKEINRIRAWIDAGAKDN